jgi:hypothetical protein
MISCDPNDLLTASRDLRALNPPLVAQIKTWLLCQLMDSGPCAAAVGVTGLGVEVVSDPVGGAMVAHLTWDAHPDQGIVFALEIMQADNIGGPYSSVAGFLAANATSYDAPLPLEVGDWFFEIRVDFNNGCPSVDSSPVEAEATCDDITWPVQNFQTTVERGANPDGYTVVATWDPHSNQPIVLEHVLQRADLIGGPYADAADPTGPGDTGAADAGLLLGIPQVDTTYFYRVATVFNNGCPAVFTDPVQVDTDCHADGFSDYVNDGDPTTTTQDVVWTLIGQPPILDFVVFWGTTQGGPYTDNSGSIPNSETSYSITGLTPATTYFTIVRARDTLACFTDSGEFSFTTAEE